MKNYLYVCFLRVSGTRETVEKDDWHRAVVLEVEISLAHFFGLFDFFLGGINFGFNFLRNLKSETER